MSEQNGNNSGGWNGPNGVNSEEFRKTPSKNAEGPPTFSSSSKSFGGGFDGFKGSGDGKRPPTFYRSKTGTDERDIQQSAKP